MSSSILILHCNLVKERLDLLEDGFILLEGDRIARFGAIGEAGGITADTVVDASGKLAIPGLINGHNHSPMTLFRGLADDLDLADWLHNHIFPAEAAHADEEMVYWCSKLAAAEMLLSGTTTVADGYFHSPLSARAFAEAGMRAVVAHGILDFPAPGVPDPADNIDAAARFVDDWLDRSPLIRPAVFAHSAYTCGPETLRRAKNLADSRGVRFFIHLAETEGESQLLIDPAGPTPLQHLAALGILDDNCVLVHAVWLDDVDLDVLEDSGAQLVLCPQSNFKLASGRGRAADLAARGLRPCLGTDSCASNNGLDMFVEMDLFAKAQKVFSLDPTLFPAAEVFHMATRAGATALGLPAAGEIAAGAAADIVLLDLAKPHLTPFYSGDLLVYAARGSDVDTVFVGGRQVVEQGRLLTFDLAETLSRVRRLACKLKP